MSSEIDKKYFHELNSLIPGEVCRRALCEYDKIRKCYIIEIFDSICEVLPEESRVIYADSGESLSQNASLFILYYLIHVQDISISKKWISEKDLPGGVQFFSGPHAIPVNLFIDQFGNNINKLKNRCSELNGEPLEMADISFTFRIARRFPIALLYWKGDEEFSPNAKILYDSSIKNQFPLDIVFVITVEFCKKIAISEM